MISDNIEYEINTIKGKVFSLMIMTAICNESGSFRPESRSPRESFAPGRFAPIPFHPGSFRPHLLIML